MEQNTNPGNIWEYFISSNHDIWCPIDLMSLARVNKLFRSIIKKFYNDYGLKSNMLKILSKHSYIQREQENAVRNAVGIAIDADAIRHAVVEEFYESTLDAGFYFFGSTLLAALLSKFGDENLPFRVGDLDLFYPAKRLATNCSAFHKALPEVIPYLTKIFGYVDRFKFSSSVNNYDNLDMFRLFTGRHRDSPQNIEFSVGIMAKNSTRYACAWKHISRSDLPLQRIFLGKASDNHNGFYMSSLEGFLGDQIANPSKMLVLSHLYGFINNLIKVGGRRIRDVYLEIPTDDEELFLQVKSFLSNYAQLQQKDNNTLICKYPF